jgi:hypothetical protein
MRALGLCLLILLSACVDRSHYLELAGGGFLFNYRDATATLQVVLVPRRDPPAGSTIEVTFENPAGGDPIVVSRAARGGGRIEMTTPPLSGIRKGVPYHAVVLLRTGSGKELVRIERDFTSDADQSVLPEHPLAIGPGYQKNIDRSTSAFPPSLWREPGGQSDAKPAK